MPDLKAMTVSGIPDEVTVDIEQRVSAIRARIEAAALRAGRDPSAITLIGVTKGQPIERIVAAALQGVASFGENYVQEAQAKRAPTLALLAAISPGSPRPSFRMIGQLQKNKLRHVIGCFDSVDSVDRASLAEALDRQAGEVGRKIDVLIQVSLAGEAQKGGVVEEQLEALVARVAELEHVRATGLMTMPPLGEAPEAARPIFKRLRELRDRLVTRPGGASLSALSMGMSADLEVAVEEGATLVRVGTALFGERAAR